MQDQAKKKGSLFALISLFFCDWKLLASARILIDILECDHQSECAKNQQTGTGFDGTGKIFFQE